MAFAGAAVKAIEPLPHDATLAMTQAAQAELTRQVAAAMAIAAPSLARAGSLGVSVRSYDADGNLIGRR